MIINAISHAKWYVTNVWELIFVEHRRYHMMIYLLLWSTSINNEGFLLWWDSTFNMYVFIRISKLLCEDMRCEIDEMVVRLDVMVLIIFIICYVRASACLVRNRRNSWCNTFPPNLISFINWSSCFRRIYEVTSAYGRACSLLDCVNSWYAPCQSLIYCYVQVK